jgi:hypothetical protein
VYLLPTTELNSPTLAALFLQTGFFIQTRLGHASQKAHVNVIDTICYVTSPCMRKLRGHKENTAPELLSDVIEHAQASRIQRKYYSSVCVAGVA